MAEPTPSATQPAGPAHAPDPEAVRVVLFGMPNAGKTSLLAAFAQAAETQQRALHFHVTKVPAALMDIRQQVYEDRAGETLEEIIPYAVRVDPPNGPPYPVVLYDCDGRVANELLSSRNAIVEGARAGRLARAVLDADALVLVVDSSASKEQIDADFREFRRFLRLLEKRRTEGREVGGLPVFLVLTKCDRLGDDEMTRDEWEDAVEERKKSVARRFKEFMAAGDAADPFLAFGSVNLQVVATAIRKPALKRSPAQPTQPVGVAELFHECLEDAWRFRDRTVRGRRQLFWTVLGSLGFVALLAVGGIVFHFTSTRERPLALAGKIENYQAREGQTASARLATPVLQRHLRELTELQQDPEFAQLPEEKQKFLQERRAELEAYVQFWEELNKVTPPRKALSLAELERVELALTKRVIPPPAYQQEWGQTEAVLQRERMLKEIPELRASVSDLRTFYQRLKGRATDLLFATEVNAEWLRSARQLFEEELSPPLPQGDTLRRLALDFEEVAAARRDWEGARERLQRVADIATAAGLTADPASPQAALAFPEPAANADAEQVNRLAAERLQALRKVYPEHGSWSLASLPDPLRPSVQKRLQRSHDLSIRTGQRLILDRLRLLNPTGPDTPPDWAKVAEWLLSPALEDWRALNLVLTKLLDPTAEDPVVVFVGFVRKPIFDIELRTLKLRIPDNLRDARLRPFGRLTVYHRPGGKDGTTESIHFKQDGEGARDGQGAVVYTFQLDGGEGKARFQPGEDFWAVLQLREGDRGWQFTWVTSKTMSYQFERLVREPRLHDPQRENTTGDLAEGVGITITDGKFPAVPALMPAVRGQR